MGPTFYWNCTKLTAYIDLNIIYILTDPLILDESERTQVSDFDAHFYLKSTP